MTDPVEKPTLTEPEAQGEYDHTAAFQRLSQTRTYLARARIDYRLAKAGCGPRERGKNHPNQQSQQLGKLAREVAYFEAQIAELINLVGEAEVGSKGLRGPAEFEEGGES